MAKRETKGETVGTLRVYFVLAGIFKGYLDVAILMRRSSIIVTVFALAGLGIACALLYLGLRLKPLVRTAPGRIQQVLMAVGVLIVAALIVNLLNRSIVGALGNLFGLAILWYLHSNTRRLRAEAAQTATEATASTAGNNNSKGRTNP